MTILVLNLFILLVFWSNSKLSCYIIFVILIKLLFFHFVVILEKQGSIRFLADPPYPPLYQLSKLFGINFVFLRVFFDFFDF